MKIYAKKTLQGLIPVSRYDFDELQAAKLKLGEVYQVEVKKPRNIKHHRKYFALLNICFENQEYFDDIEDLRNYIIMKSGYVKKVTTPDGEFYRAKSISFSSMDQIEFEKLYNKSIDIVIAILGVERDDLMVEINGFL